MGEVASTSIFGRLPRAQAPAVAQFHPEPQDVTDVLRSPDPDNTFFRKRTEPRAAPPELSFGPFRLLATQFFLLEGDEPVSTFFASDEHGRIATVCAVVAVAAALDLIRTAFALAPNSLRAGPCLRVARGERTEL